MFNEVANDQDFAKLTGGLDNVEYVTLVQVCRYLYITASVFAAKNRITYSLDLN